MCFSGLYSVTKSLKGNNVVLVLEYLLCFNLHIKPRGITLSDYVSDSAFAAIVHTVSFEKMLM